jgi:hypothetical protein
MIRTGSSSAILAGPASVSGAGAAAAAVPAAVPVASVTGALLLEGSDAPLPAGTVLMAVKAVGVNFRDVLNVSNGLQKHTIAERLLNTALCTALAL